MRCLICAVCSGRRPDLLTVCPEPTFTIRHPSLAYLCLVRRRTALDDLRRRAMTGFLRPPSSICAWDERLTDEYVRELRRPSLLTFAWETDSVGEGKQTTEREKTMKIGNFTVLAAVVAISFSLAAYVMAGGRGNGGMARTGPVTSSGMTNRSTMNSHIKTSPTPPGKHLGWQKGRHNPHRSPTPERTSANQETRTAPKFLGAVQFWRDNSSRYDFCCRKLLCSRPIRLTKRFS